MSGKVQRCTAWGRRPGVGPEKKTPVMSHESSITSVAELANVIDRLGPDHVLDAHAELGRAHAAAQEGSDLELQSAIRAEGAVLELFAHANNLHVAVAERKSAFTKSDLEYIERRRVETPRANMRARYGHALAWATKRFDIGQEAAQAYVDAVEEAVASSDPIERERALRHLAPLTMELGKRYRKLPQAVAALSRAIESARAVLRLQILRLLVPEPKLDRAQRERLREPLLTTIADLAGTSLLDSMVEAARLGIRLDAKLGNADPSAWHRALLDGLKRTISAGEHPLLRERAAQQATLVLQTLGADEERAEMIATLRELATGALPESSHSEPIDADGAFAVAIRASLDTRLPEFGEIGLLAYLGLSSEFMPRVQHAREALAKQRAAGIGVFRQFATTVVRARDNRVVGHGDPGQENEGRALAEQFGYGCIYAWYAMDVATRHVIANGTVRREHFAMLLVQSWIGVEEKNVKNDLVPLLLAPLATYIDVLTGVQPQEALIPAVDSLTMRFEAVLRKLARMLGVSDTKELADQSGRLVSEVLGIEAVLRHPRIRRALGEDLHELARHTLLGQDEGLRHSVGHGVTHLEDYGVFTAHSLVFLLLRLAMVQLNGDEPDDDSAVGTLTNE